MISCILVDDEPFAREALAELLVRHPDVNIVAQASNAIEAIQAINQHKPALLFLDIQMPRISGMELLAMLDKDTMPRVVFVTAFDEYAIKAFELHAFDYLLKPIDDARLANTMDRVRKDQRPQDVTSLAPERLAHLPCFSGNRLKVVPIEEVEYVFSDVGGIHVSTANGRVHTQMTLKLLEEKTPLIFCHRQYLIAPAAIAEIVLLDGGAEVVTRSGARVPVSRRYLKELKSHFGFL
ncbi:two-component system response regulator BtsR [Shewanella amazonensis]|uniref:Response regulator receiver protein n=1 Tax=Shewanella amazonensis (strain ATCC BAA-1098 / SB2B) TaxID=326297 RepID=A1S532_SHEAM|nr:two-component system response regulator BtsR [Shewanella amazonensis]ABL99488.1 response regulator receiver protein [Shewanella amazonensis SB2B]